MKIKIPPLGIFRAKDKKQEDTRVSIIDAEVCEICGKPFTSEEWYNHHFEHDGLVYHESCCPICQEEEENV